MNKKFTKDDIKAGYIVKMRDGSLNMVTINKYNELIMVDKNGGWTSLVRYDKYLKNTGSGLIWSTPSVETYDIMEVYGGCQFNNKALELNVEDRELLWKREEKTCDSCAHKVVCTHVGTCEHYMAKN